MSAPRRRAEASCAGRGSRGDRSAGAGGAAGQRIGPGRTVALHYRLTTQSGELLEATAPGRPIEFVFGTGTVVRGLEEGVAGLKAGDRATIELEPAKGYGVKDRTKMIRLRRGELHGKELEVGQTIRRLCTDGRTETFVVTGFLDDWVHADGNHPYAGLGLLYEVEIVAVR